MKVGVNHLHQTRDNDFHPNLVDFLFNTWVYAIRHADHDGGIRFQSFGPGYLEKEAQS